MDPLDGYDNFKLQTPPEYETAGRMESLIGRTPHLAALAERLARAEARVTKLEARAKLPHPYGKRLARVTDWARRTVLYLERELEGAIEEECEPPDPPDREDD